MNREIFRIGKHRLNGPQFPNLINILHLRSGIYPDNVVVTSQKPRVSVK